MYRMLGMAAAAVFALGASLAHAEDVTGPVENIDLTRNTFQVGDKVFTAAPNNTVGPTLEELNEGDQVTVSFEDSGERRADQRDDDHQGRRVAASRRMLGWRSPRRPGIAPAASRAAMHAVDAPQRQARRASPCGGSGEFMAGGTDGLRREGGGALAEGALHDHRVQPAAELAADVLQNSDQAEPGLLVQADRCDVGGVADDRHHLTHAAAGGVAHHRVQESPPDALTARKGRDVDRVLDRVAVAWPGAIGAGIGIARDSSALLGDEVGQSRTPDRLPAHRRARPDPAARARTRPCPRAPRARRSRGRPSDPPRRSPAAAAAGSSRQAPGSGHAARRGRPARGPAAPGRSSRNTSASIAVSACRRSSAGES